MENIFVLHDNTFAGIYQAGKRAVIVEEDKFTQKMLKNVKIILMSAVYQFSMFRMKIEDTNADYFVNNLLDTGRLFSLVREIMASIPDLLE